MKRLAWTAAAVAAIALVSVFLVLVFLPRDALKARLGQQIAAWTGRDVSLRGEPELDFFPRLTVTLKDVQVSGPAGMTDAEIVTMERLEGTVRLLPLIIGQVEIVSFRMVRPLLRLVREPGGGRNWAFDSGAAALQLAFAGDVPLGEFFLEDGTLVFENRQTGATERVDSLSLALQWPSVRQPLSMSGSGIWRGEQVNLFAGAQSPFEFVRGDATPVEVRIESGPVDMSFTGEAADPNNPQISGALTLLTPSLRGFAGWLGSPIGPGSTLGSASLSGAAVFREGVLSVDDAKVSLDGNDATGALTIIAGAVPDVTGTLAFPSLDLTPYFAGLATAVRGPTGWHPVKLDAGWLRDVSGDVRLSAGAMQIGTLRFGNSAFSASIRQARLEIGLAEAAFNGGTLSGMLAMAELPGGAGAQLEAQLRGSDIDLAQAAPALALPATISGLGSASTDLRGSGPDFGALVNGLNGTSSLDVRNGAIPLFGMAELAGNIINPAAAAGGGAATPIDALTARMTFANGSARVEQAQITAPGFTADATGQIGLHDGVLDLTGAIRPPGEGAPLPFAIKGTLAQPAARPLIAGN